MKKNEEQVLRAWRDTDNFDVVIAYSAADASDVWHGEYGKSSLGDLPRIEPDVYEEIPSDHVLILCEEEDHPRRVTKHTIAEWIALHGRGVLCVDTGEV